MYWALQTLATVGFGDVPCVTNPEMIYAIFWMGAGSAFFSFMISNLQGTNQDSEKNIQSKLIQLEQMKKQYSIPADLFTMIKKHIETTGFENNRAQVITSTKGLIKQLPTCLRASVLLSIYAHVIERVQFLQDKDIELILQLIPKLNQVNFSKGDIIYLQDDYPEEVYFISTGEIELKDANGENIHVHSDGDTCGLVEIVYDIRRLSVAFCSKRSLVYSIDRNMFLKILLSYPNLLSEVKN